MPHFILPKAGYGRFCFAVGKGGGENWNKSKRNLLNNPQNLVHRAVHTLKINCEYLFEMPLCGVT